MRDYGTAKWEGGSAECDHRQQLGGEGTLSAKQNTSAGTQAIAYRDVCGKCGAIRIDSQLGLECTPEEYVAKMVEVFREVRRVLKDDAVLFLNIGDSYNGYMANQRATSISAHNQDARPSFESGHGKRTNSLSAKDMVGIPWRLAFALQADGWILRQDIIWAKPNPMPESVRDRCTKSHEYLFLLSKKERYYWDQEAIREPQTGNTHSRGKGNTPKDAPAGSGIKSNTSFNKAMASYIEVPGGRNRRSVWTIPTQPYPEAHFATFPDALVEPCILAGSRLGDVVLDPFMGAGTVGVVAGKLGRKWIGIELNPDYCRMAEERIRRETAQQNMFHSKI